MVWGEGEEGAGRNITFFISISSIITIIISILIIIISRSIGELRKTRRVKHFRGAPEAGRTEDPQPQPQTSTPNELKSKLLTGEYRGDYIGEYYRADQGDARSLDSSATAPKKTQSSSLDPWAGWNYMLKRGQWQPRQESCKNRVYDLGFWKKGLSYDCDLEATAQLPRVVILGLSTHEP